MTLDLFQLHGERIMPTNGNVKVSLVEGRAFQRLGTLWSGSLARVLSSSNGVKKIDIIHDHGAWHQVNHTVRRLADRIAIPRIVSVRGVLMPAAMSQKSLKKRVAWWAFQRSDFQRAQALHATSGAEAMAIRSWGLDVPIAIIPNGIELPATEPAPRRNVTTARVALVLSRVHPSKGISNLIEAWAQVRPDGWRCVVAGPDEGGYLQTIRAQVQREGLGQCFEFLGQVDDHSKWSLLERADLFILPTLGENFGLVIAEALGMGVPVITTKAAPWSALEDLACGWWVDPSPSALALAIAHATALPAAVRCNMGKIGRRHIQREYSWDVVATQMTDVYQWMLGRAEAPKCLELA